MLILSVIGNIFLHKKITVYVARLSNITPTTPVHPQRTDLEKEGDEGEPGRKRPRDN